MRLNLRLPGREIWENRHYNAGTAFLVIGMISGLFSEMVSKDPAYENLTRIDGVSPLISISLALLVTLASANLMVLPAAEVSRRITKQELVENYTRNGVALLPPALLAFMAFHVFYLVNLGVQLPILLSETFDLEVFRRLIITPSPEWPRLIQQILIWTGLAWSLMAIHRLGRSNSTPSSSVLLGCMPHAGAALIFAILLSAGMKSDFYG